MLVPITHVCGGLCSVVVMPTHLNLPIFYLFNIIYLQRQAVVRIYLIS